MSIARRTFPSRLELKREAGSFSDAPLAKVSFTAFLYDSPVQMMPSCDQTGVPIHFHSSTTSGSASLMSLRILASAFPRQSPSSAIRFEMSCDADWPWLAPGLFMFSSSIPVRRWQRAARLPRRPSRPNPLGEPLAVLAGRAGGYREAVPVSDRARDLGEAPDT